jgi:hypothetical protein
MACLPSSCRPRWKGAVRRQEEIAARRQQRLTSLYVLFKGVPPPFYEGESLFFDLYFNLQTEEFHFWQKSLMANNPMWWSVHEVLRDGLATLLGRLDELAATEQEAIRANLKTLSLLDRIRDYEYAVDTLKDDSLNVDEVVTIFNNVNSGGTKLSRADLAMAHVCTEWPEARAELREFSQRMKHHGFPIETEYLIRAVAGAADGVVTFTPAFYSVPADTLRSVWPKVMSAYEHLINELAHHALIDSIGDLTTPLVLVPVLVFLSRHGSSFRSASERDRFLRWMFLANIWSRYAGQTDTRLQRDVRIVLEDDDPTQRLEQEILRDRGRIRLEARDLEGKGAQTAIYKFGYVVARWRNAVDWFTGTTLYSKAVGKSYGLESHHVFPQDVLRKNGFESRESRKLINEVANRAFLTRKANRTISNKNPATYLARVEKHFPGALQAQCVPMDSELWKVANYEEFLRQRRTQLAKAMNQFLDRLAHAGTTEARNDDRTIERLLESDEGPSLEFKSSLRMTVPGGELNKALEKTAIKSVAGFLNSTGGTLLIGVDNSGEALGLEADYLSLQKEGRDVRDTFQLHLTNLLARALGEPALAFVTSTCHSIRRRDVCQIVVEASDHPIYVTEGESSVFHLRMGAQTRALSLQHTVQYVASHWGDGLRGWMPPLDEVDAAEPEPAAEAANGADSWLTDESAFVEYIEIAPVELRSELRRLLEWAEDLGSSGLLGGFWSHGGRRPALVPYSAGEKGGLVAIRWDGAISLYRSVFNRTAPDAIDTVEKIIAPVKLGKGSVVHRVPDALLEALKAAYAEAAGNVARPGAGPGA